MSIDRSGNPLISQPWLYEYIYPNKNIDEAHVCENILNKYMPDKIGLDILEVGCGIGQVLMYLKEIGHNAIGIDISKPMIDYALELHPELDIVQADMRDFALDRRFDVIACVGSTFTYNLRNEEIHSTLKNFRMHCKDDGLLILGMINASQFLGAAIFNERSEIRVDEGDFHGSAVARHFLNRRKQCFRRVRTWRIEGYPEPIVDDAEFRLIFPMEIEDYLNRNGFALLDLWDNINLRATDLSGRRLYLAAKPV